MNQDLFTLFADNAPFLESNYPQFSWDDFPKSRDALVRGKPTSQFETSCWNTMVDRVEMMIALLGWSWTAAPYFYYGESKLFTAQMYNTMLSGMYQLIPVYEWEQRNVYQAHKGDYLTTEHIKFVAKNLNKVIRLANGTDQLARVMTDHNSAIITDVPTIVKPAWPITSYYFGNITSRTFTDMELKGLPSVPIFTDHIGKTVTAAAVVARTAERLEADHNSRTKSVVFPEKRAALPGGASVASRSRSKVNLSKVIAGGQPKTASCSFSKLLAEAFTPASYLLSASGFAFSMAKATAFVQTGSRAEAEHTGHSLIEPKMNSVPSCPLVFLPMIGRSNTMADISGLISVETGKIHTVGHSGIEAKLIPGAASSVNMTHTDKTIALIEMETRQAEPTATNLETWSSQQIQAITQTARPTWADGKSVSTSDLVLKKLPAVNIKVDDTGITTQSCTLDLLDAADIQSNTLAFGSVSCEAAIFLLPLKPDKNTLYIRQTYQEPLKIGNTLYIDQWPDQGLTDDGTLFLWRIFDTVIHVGNTLYIGSMPNTGMTDGETLLIWDVEQEPVKENTLLEVF